ncbi:MAG: MDR/zinc-dependent alcohol dehydrogenase-like family protein [Prochlorothrix sp.]
MQALWLEHQKLQLRQDLPLPTVAPGEVRVRVLQAGICNTDLELLRGYYPYQGVLGHEFVGEVDQGPTEWLGRRVVGEINASCGTCEDCLSDRANHCQFRSVLGIVKRDGAFAEYLTLPQRNLHAVPESLSTDVATFTEPVAAALEIQEQLTITPSQRVVVIGDGKLGLLVAQTLALTGCQLWAIGRHPEKLALLQTRGIHTALPEALPERHFDIAVDCTGNPSGFETARRSLRPRGILVVKSTYADRLTVDMSALVVDEITLVGSRCGPFAKALQVLEKGLVDVQPLIQGRYPLGQALEAFAHAQQRGTLKVLLTMS